MTTDADDIPSGSGLTEYSFAFINSTVRAAANNGGEIKICISHISGAPVGAHLLDVDFFRVLFASVELDMPGTWYIINNAGISNGTAFGMTVNAALGNIVIGSLEGQYDVYQGGSATGTPGTTMHGHVFLNDVEQHQCGWTASFTGLEYVPVQAVCRLDLSTGDVLDVRVRSDIADSFMQLEHFTLDVKFRGG
jgi:hypothetical protein